MSGQTVGDIMSSAKITAAKTIAFVASVLVYMAMLTYSGVHNYTLLTKGVPEDLLIWAIVGVVALEISGAALPIALHYWTHAPLQRFVAIAFYLVDIGLLWLNVVLDFALVSHQAGLPEWANLYLTFAAPATPLIAGGGWALIWLLDPSQRKLATQQALQASVQEALAARLAEAARSSDLNGMVERAAETMAHDIVHDALGVYGQQSQQQLTETTPPLSKKEHTQ